MRTNSRRLIRKSLQSRDKLLNFLRQDEGLTIVEYAVAAGLVVAAVAASFVVLGATIDAIIVTVIAAV